MSWLYFLYPTSTSSYHQRGSASSHYKCPSTTSRTITFVVNASFLSNEYFNYFIFGQIESSNHFCSSSSIVNTVVLYIVPACCSYCFYSVFSGVRHGPLLRTVEQCNLTLMILTCVMTTNWFWTRSSSGTEICKDGIECWVARKLKLVVSFYLLILIPCTDIGEITWKEMYVKNAFLSHWSFNRHCY